MRLIPAALCAVLLASPASAAEGRGSVDKALSVARALGHILEKPAAPSAPRSMPVARESGAFAASCNNRTTCWDYCTSGWVRVSGDACDTDWDIQRGCWQAVGRCTCGGGGGGGCNNRTTCWDYCSSGWVRVPGESCGTEWNHQRGCWEAYGIHTCGASAHAHDHGTLAAQEQPDKRYFIGCRPSPGECYNSCPRGYRIIAQRDPGVCPTESFEPWACYCVPR